MPIHPTEPVIPEDDVETVLMEVAPYQEKIASFETADDIAEFLMGEEIRAYAGKPKHCAIAEYIRRGSGHTVSQSWEETFIWRATGDGDVPVLVSTNTPAMKAFAMKFDQGLYPDLIAHKEDED